MQTLLDILQLPSDEQLREIWSRRFHHARGTAGRFSDLMPWAELDRILTHHRLEPPRMQLVRGDRYAPAGDYIRYATNHRGERLPHIIPERFSELVRDGHTLIVDEVDEASPAVARMARAIEMDVRESVQANLYAGWREEPAFRRHWDDHDVLALQVTGRKQWRIYQGGRRFPTQFDVEVNAPPPTELAWDGILEAGDALYIPRGWWHEAAAVGEPTLHLTIGFTNRTGIHLMDRLVDAMRHVEMFRADLPRFAAPDEQRRHMSLLRGELLRVWDDDVLGRFLEREDFLARRRTPIGLPWSTENEPSLPDGARLTLASPRPLVFTEDGDGGGIRFRALNNEWRFGADARSLLERLAAGPATMADLVAASDGQTREAVGAFVGALLHAGLLVVE